MSAISLTGLGASTPIWSYLPNEILAGTIVLVEKKSFKDPTGNEVVQFEQHYASPTPSTLPAIGLHFDPELEELAEQFSAVSQVNVSFKNVKPGTNGSHPSLPSAAPTDAVLRHGYAWNLPFIRRSPIIDVLPTHGPLIMTHYHSDVRST